MKLEIDISGQIYQLKYNSALGCKRSDGLEKSVFLRSQTKKEIIKEYKGQVTNLIEKLHCIMIYYCIKDNLKGVREIKICRDASFRKIKAILPFLFKERNYLNNIKITQRKGEESKSKAHNIALKSFRRRRYAEEIISKERIENVLFKFKK